MASTAAQVPYAHPQQQPPPRIASSMDGNGNGAVHPQSYASGPPSAHPSERYSPAEQFSQMSLQGTGVGREDDEYYHHPHIPSRPVLDNAAQTHSQAQIHGVPLPQAHNQAFPAPAALGYEQAATAGQGQGMSYPSGGPQQGQQQGQGGQQGQRQSYAAVPGFAAAGGSLVGGGERGSVVGGSTVGGQREVSGAMPLLDNCGSSVAGTAKAQQLIPVLLLPTSPPPARRQSRPPFP